MGGVRALPGVANGISAQVKTFNNATGWGFITTSTGEDVFFVRDYCPDGKAFQAQPGDAVLYDGIQIRRDGRRCAQGVRLAGSSACGLPAVVKTFNSATGWGFLTTPRGDDLFFI